MMISPDLSRGGTTRFSGMYQLHHTAGLCSRKDSGAYKVVDVTLLAPQGFGGKARNVIDGMPPPSRRNVFDPLTCVAVNGHGTGYIRLDLGQVKTVRHIALAGLGITTNGDHIEDDVHFKFNLQSRAQGLFCSQRCHMTIAHVGTFICSKSGEQVAANRFPFFQIC